MSLANILIVNNANYQDSDENLKNMTDGIVIGSPIVEKINQDPSLKELKQYVEPIIEAIKT